MNVKLYNEQGEATGELTLAPETFGLPVNETLVHQAMRTQMSNARAPLAHVKIRSEVRGGGKKPWRQKGTGRARHGSIRSPLWKGGGATFGPRKNRSFTLRMNKKARRKAVAMVLSDKARHERIVALEQLEPKEYKAKTLLTLIGKLPVERRVLLIIAKANAKVTKSIANVAMISALRADSLNVVELLKADYLVITKASLEVIQGGARVETVKPKTRSTKPAAKSTIVKQPAAKKPAVKAAKTVKRTK